MASTNWNGFAPLQGVLGSAQALHEGSVRNGYVPLTFDWLSGVFATRVRPSRGAMIPMRVKVPIYLLRGQFGGVTETWIGGSPDTAPPSGHVLTNRSYIILEHC